MDSGSPLAGRIVAWSFAAAMVGSSVHPLRAEEPAPSGALSSQHGGPGTVIYARGNEVASVPLTLQMQMDEYRRAYAMLEAAYRRLLVRMDHAEQLALGGEQTIWLNEEEAACGPASALNYNCEAKWSFAQAATLTAWQVTSPEAIVAPKRRLRLPVTPPHSAWPGRTVKTYFVPVTAMPWLWRPGGENRAFSFGYPNGTAPVVVPLAALGAGRVRSLTIEYAGGEIAIGQAGRPADARGYSGLNSETGPLGAFPSRYIRGHQVNLGALVGVFTDGAGNILGAPFAVGAGKMRRKIPARARQLQFGINDDVFGGSTAETRNSGGFTVRVARGAG